MKNHYLFYNPAGFLTLFFKEMRRFVKVSVQTIVAPLLSNILYLIIFGEMLRARSTEISGTSFLLYIVPGLVEMGAIFAAFMNPASSISSQKYQKTIQDMNSYPISNIEKALAFILGGTFRGLLIGILTYAAAGFFVGFTIEFPILFWGMIMVTSFVFAAVGLICGLLSKNNEILTFFLSIVITPLVYLGGVFFEISSLPGPLTYIRYINPVYPLVNIARYAYLGNAEGNILIQSIAVSIISVFCLWIATYCIKKGYGVKVM